MNKRFSVDVHNINITQSNRKDFLIFQLQAIAEGETRNNSAFTADSLISSLPTFYNKPILAYYNCDIDDTEEHNSQLAFDENGEIFYNYQYKTAEKPCGMIPESAIVSVKTIEGKQWIVVDNAIIWTEYNHQLIHLLGRQKHKKVSVEIEVLNSEMNGDIEIIKEFKLLGITILGEHIAEGIENAHLSIYGLEDNINNYRARFSNAYSNSIVSKYDIKNGSGKSIKTNKSKEAVSHDSWGNISKTALRNKVLKAANYKSLVNDVYLKVEEDWEVSPSDKLKYPVMQFKQGEFVYNANGLLSAQQYGESNDKPVAEKAESIRKKLGLITKEKRDSMKKFVDAAKLQGYAYIGKYGDKLRFVKEGNEQDDVEKMSVEAYEADCDVENFEEDKMEKLSLYTDEEVRAKSEELSKEKFDALEEKIDALEAERSEIEKKSDELEVKADELEIKIDELEKQRDKAQADFDACNSELETLKMAKFEEDTDEDMEDEDELEDDDKEELKKMRADKKFSNREEFVREMAYMISLRNKQRRQADRQSLTFSGKEQQPKVKTKIKNSALDAIDKI